MLTKKQFISGTIFFDAESGEEYKHYFFNRTNNYLMTMLGIEVYLITKITSKGYFYRGFCRQNELYHPTDLFKPFRELKVLKTKAE
jgi:hypothetical protein